MTVGKVARLGSIAAAVLMSMAARGESKRYLVQFKSTSTFEALAQKAPHSQWTPQSKVALMRLFNTNAVVHQSLQNVKLMVIESEDAKAIQSLRAHPSIALVEEEMFHPAPQPVATKSPQDTEVSGGFETSVKMPRPWGIDAVKAPQAWTQTKGQGARVLVLDTGVDKTHVALVRNIEKLKNFTSPDATDVADTVGHGTHVAGTVLADGAEEGLVGVAPQAKLLMGKVCSDRGCSSIAIVNGLDWAMQEKVDVVNMSLGGMFLSQAEAQALRRAEEAGVFIAAASGNDGNGRVSYPAAFPTVLAVGAVDSDLQKADFSQWGPELAIVAPGVEVFSALPAGSGRGSVVRLNLDGKSLNDIKSNPFQGSPAAGVESDFVFVGLGKPEDFAKANVRGKVALIGRGEIAFKDKVANAIAAGAIGAVVFNNVPGLIQGGLTDDGSEVAIPAAMIEQQVGEAAKAALAAGQTVRGIVQVQRTDYGSLQGTSMATPHVAGVAALVRAANKTLTPAQVREILRSTATPLQPNDQNQLGSGLVNAEAAVNKAKLQGAVSGLTQVIL
jgi:serine protease